MTHYDQTMKAYAANGFRSAAEWLTLGREVEAGVASRAEAVRNGLTIPLYTRGQTKKLSRPAEVAKA
jgi:hypothetical protein